MNKEIQEALDEWGKTLKQSIENLKELNKKIDDVLNKLKSEE